MTLPSEINPGAPGSIAALTGTQTEDWRKWLPSVTLKPRASKSR
jgi:hypothetical protein